jgi:hypothetical protein
MKSQKGKYVEINRSFSVTVSKNRGKPRFAWTPVAVYITHDHHEINMHYAGERAGDSSTVFTLPTDSDFLRRLSTAFLELADQYSP